MVETIEEVPLAPLVPPLPNNLPVLPASPVVVLRMLLLCCFFSSTSLPCKLITADDDSVTCPLSFFLEDDPIFFGDIVERSCRRIADAVAVVGDIIDDAICCLLVVFDGDRESVSFPHLTLLPFFVDDTSVAVVVFDVDDVFG